MPVPIGVAIGAVSDRISLFKNPIEELRKFETRVQTQLTNASRAPRILLPICDRMVAAGLMAYS
jgi:hypothetical protein